MKKRTRFIIFLLCIAFCLYFLVSTIRWYAIFTPDDKKEAALVEDKLKEAIDKKIDNAFLILRENDKKNSEYNSLYQSVKKAFDKEISDYNKLNKEIPIKPQENSSFSDMEKILSETVSKKKYVDTLMRDTLETYYTKVFDEKKRVKNDIIKLGLDLQGGAYAVIQVNFNAQSMLERKKSLGRDFTQDEKNAMIDSAILKIENRINKFGISETSIQKLKGQDKIIINLPGVKDTTELRQIIETVGVLEFKVVSREGNEIFNKIYLEYNANNKPLFDTNKKLLPEVQALLPVDTEVLPVSSKDKYGRENKDNITYMVVNKESLLGNNMKITSASVQTSNIGKYVVNFELDGESAKTWAAVTEKYKGYAVAIILDNVVLTSPVVQDKITGGKSEITLGDAPYNELYNLALVLKSGSLNVPLEISEENTVGASLGQDTITKGLNACLLGIIFVLIFMFLWYNIGGLIANVAVLLNILLLVCLMAVFKGSLTLPGIAGIVLTVGMAVDANVIIYERIKEEFRAGKSFRTAVHLGFDRAFWTILDSNLTTFASGIGLSMFGTGAVKGFAVTLCLGIVTTLFTTLFASRLMFDALTSAKEFKTIRLIKLIGGVSK